MANLDMGMSSTSTVEARASAEATTKTKFFNLKVMTVLTLLIIAWVVIVRWYQMWAGWEFGMDATRPEFQKYWMSLFYGQIAFFTTAFVLSVGGLWMTRDRHLDKITPREELRRMMTFLSLLFVYAFQFVWAGSFFAEQDAAWHQVVVRDTSFTPSHIVLFYGLFPAFVVLGFSAYTYAMTRLPLYAKGISIPLVIATVGPMMTLPNVGYNEFGHAFWLMEERFTDPLHYGFVFFGWAILGLGGILVQIMARVSVLMSEVFGGKARSA